MTACLPVSGLVSRLVFALGLVRLPIAPRSDAATSR